MAVDLDAARAARREAKGEGPTVKFGGHEMVLDPEVPYGVLEEVVAIQRAPKDSDERVLGLGRVARLLLGDENAEALFAGRPSVEDLDALIEGVLREYGLGEAQAASSPSSRGTSRPRKRTS